MIYVSTNMLVHLSIPYIETSGNLNTTPAWCSFHSCSEGCRISSKMVEPPRRDKSSETPKHAPKIADSEQRTKKKKHVAGLMYRKNRDPVFLSIGAMLIRVTRISSAFTTKELRWALAVVTCAPHHTCTKGGLELYIDHKRYVVEPFYSKGVCICCSLKKSKSKTAPTISILHGTFLSQMVTFQADDMPTISSRPCTTCAGRRNKWFPGNSQLAPFTQQLKKVDEEVQEIQVQIPGRQGIPRSKKNIIEMIWWSWHDWSHYQLSAHLHLSKKSSSLEGFIQNIPRRVACPGYTPNLVFLHQKRLRPNQRFAVYHRQSENQRAWHQPLPPLCWGP